MKIRILGNSIRYRLRQPEVAAFAQNGTLSEVTQLGPLPSQQLVFQLHKSLSEELTVSIKDNTVTLCVPQSIAQTWATTEQVGFSGEIKIGSGKTLSVLVEKDFFCLDRSEEEEVGAYPNPKAVC